MSLFSPSLTKGLLSKRQCSVCCLNHWLRGTRNGPETLEEASSRGPATLLQTKTPRAVIKCDDLFLLISAGTPTSSGRKICEESKKFVSWCGGGGGNEKLLAVEEDEAKIGNNCVERRKKTPGKHEKVTRVVVSFYDFCFPAGRFFFAACVLDLAQNCVHFLSANWRLTAKLGIDRNWWMFFFLLVEVLVRMFGSFLSFLSESAWNSRKTSLEVNWKFWVETGETLPDNFKFQIQI